MIVSVRDKPGAGNDGTYTLSGLFAPSSTGKVLGLVHIYVIVTINEFDLSTGAGPVLFDLLRNSCFSHGIDPHSYR